MYYFKCKVGETPEMLRTAKAHPEQIGYPFTFNGKLMKIPKIPFLQFLGLVDVYFSRMKQKSSAPGGHPSAEKNTNNL